MPSFNPNQIFKAIIVHYGKLTPIHINFISLNNAFVGACCTRPLVSYACP
ncbi:hypothetical protein [Moraxella lacunata]